MPASKCARAPGVCSNTERRATRASLADAPSFLACAPKDTTRRRSHGSRTTSRDTSCVSGAGVSASPFDAPVVPSSFVAFDAPVAFGGSDVPVGGFAAASSSLKAGGASAATDIVDVLVKLIRLVAHLGISPHIGEQIVTRPQALALLKVLHSYSMEQHEELQLNAISAVTNLSYYLVDGSVLLSSHEALCRALIPVLVFPNTEGMVEASRALGNLSRLQDARARIHDQHIWVSVLQDAVFSAPYTTINRPQHPGLALTSCASAPRAWARK